MKTKMYLGAALLAVLTGCFPSDPKDSKSNPETRQASKGSAKADAPPGGVFDPPAPMGAAEDARTIAAQAGNEKLLGALGMVRERVKAIRDSLEQRRAVETDIVKVVEGLRTATMKAREDCDTVLRAARDLRSELKLARRSYEAMAERYRDQARSFRDPRFRDAESGQAEEFERLASDVPRRIRLTDRFIEQVTESQDFLAETDRFLGDTKVALTILSVGPEPYKPSAEAKYVRSQITIFLETMEEYQRKFFEFPKGDSPKVPEGPAPKSDEGKQSSPPPTPKDASVPKPDAPASPNKSSHMEREVQRRDEAAEVEKARALAAKPPEVKAANEPGIPPIPERLQTEILSNGASNSEPPPVAKVQKASLPIPRIYETPSAMPATPRPRPSAPRPPQYVSVTQTEMRQERCPQCGGMRWVPVTVTYLVQR